MIDDFEITPAQRRYLAAFDQWLHSSWKIYAPAVNDGPTRRKDACLAAMLAEPPHLPRCVECGDPFVQNHVGRKRTRCFACMPKRKKAAA